MVRSGCPRDLRYSSFRSRQFRMAAFQPLSIRVPACPNHCSHKKNSTPAPDARFNRPESVFRPASQWRLAHPARGTAAGRGRREGVAEACRRGRLRLEAHFSRAFGEARRPPGATPPPLLGEPPSADRLVHGHELGAVGEGRSTCTSWIISGTPRMHCAAATTWAPAYSATERPSRAPFDDEVGDQRDRRWPEPHPRASRLRATIAASDTRSLSFSRGSGSWHSQLVQMRGRGSARNAIRKRISPARKVRASAPTIRTTSTSSALCLAGPR